MSERRVARRLPVQLATLRYRDRRDPQVALRMRLRELAASRVRFGYRRLTVMLRREGWRVNAKRIYRLYTEDGLAVRTKVRKKLARRMRVPMVKATRPNEKWSMDFVAARLLDERWFRVLTVVDQFTRECLALLADSSLTGHKVALALSQVVAERGAPVSITVDNGSEFVSKAMGRGLTSVASTWSLSVLAGRWKMTISRNSNSGGMTTIGGGRTVRSMTMLPMTSQSSGSQGAQPPRAPLGRRRRPARCMTRRLWIQNRYSFSVRP
jgi:hypothetical protein